MGGRYRAGRVEIITEPLNASIRRIHSDGQPYCKSILNVHDVDYFTFDVQTLLHYYIYIIYQVVILLSKDTLVISITILTFLKIKNDCSLSYNF